MTTHDDRDRDDRQVRPFAAWLQEQARGKSHTELSIALHDLVAKVRETGKKGTLVFKVIVEPLDKEMTALKVSDDIDLRLPQHDRPTSIAYVDRAGNLTRKDPAQLELPVLKSLDDPPHDPVTGEIKEAT